MPMTWTRTVLIMALLGSAVVPTSAQSNAATSNLTATAHADRLRIKRPNPSKRLRVQRPKPTATMSVVIPVSPVTKIRADVSTGQQWEKQWRIRTIQTRLTVANRVTALAVHMSKRVAPRIRFLFALLKTPGTR